jgi:hypothetical protein
MILIPANIQYGSILGSALNFAVTGRLMLQFVRWWGYLRIHFCGLYGHAVSRAGEKSCSRLADGLASRIYRRTARTQGTVMGYTILIAHVEKRTSSFQGDR